MDAKIVFLVLLPAIAVDAAGISVSANPIRKVVTMLQLMQKKVEAEGVKEKALFEKFMCYCKNGAGDLKGSIAAATTKEADVTSDINEAVAKLAQHEAELKDHHADRNAAKAAMAEATALRERQAADFAKEDSDSNANINALRKAIAALRKGMAGGFLQTSSANALRRLVVQQSNGMTDFDRREVLAFLSNDGSWAPRSGEITGILEQMLETMDADLAAAIAAEKASIKAFNELMAANNKIILASTAAIERKLQRAGELKVAIVNMKADVSDTMEAQKEDAAFLANLAKDCKTKETEYAARIKTRAEELVALAETIKILNDDDALELFKKTLPSASAFVQIKVSTSAVRSRVLDMVHGLQKKCTSNCAQLDLVALALRGKKFNFAKVIAMIDDMVALLLKEQTEDDNKKEYCLVTFDTLDDQKKALERTVSDLAAAIAETKDAIETLTADIDALNTGIKSLDKSVAGATEQRKEEHEDFTTLVAQDTAAKELLKIAKNRLNQFYNPKLYVAPAKRELSREGRVYENLGGDIPVEAAGGIADTGVTVFEQRRVAPGPAPETFGAYSKKTGGATGVIEMIDLLIAELDKELTEATTEEKDAQADYEQLMADSASKRASDSKLLAEKVASKAEAGANLLAQKEDKGTTEKKLMATLEVIHGTHAECDWLLQNFDARKDARAGEVDSLKSAKAILSGADYSL